MGADHIYAIGGLALLSAVVLPHALRRIALSAPLVLVIGALLVGLLPMPQGVRVSPIEHRALTEHLSELCVIVALMGVGLALDRPLSLRRRDTWRSWRSTWPLLLVAMPLTIAGTALVGWWVLGLAPAGALLLGAALAPTDPVLAADVQVEGPTTEAMDQVDEHDEVRFALTSEAGLNDALAFPFVYAAIYLASVGPLGDWLLGWLGWELIGKTLIGGVVGVIGGHLLGRVAFRSGQHALRLAERGEPLLALGVTLLVYGVTELAGGWGFLAVFVSALTLRAAERHHKYHELMHQLIERLELLLTLLLLMLLGVALTDGLLEHLSWSGVLVGAALILVIRPLSAWISYGRRDGADEFGGRRLGPRERLITAAFGVRGIGSIYYLAYATGAAHFADAEVIWSTVAFTVLASVLLHGVAATPAMRWLDEVRQPRGSTPS